MTQTETQQEEKPKYPTYFDEVLAQVPLDSWVTFQDVWKKLKDRPYMNRGYVKFCLRRGVRKKFLVNRDTGTTKTAKKGSTLVCPVYIYRRIITVRPFNGAMGARRPNRWKPGDNKTEKRRKRKKKHNHNRKLTDDQVREIRRLRQCGLTHDDLGRMFGVDGSKIGLLLAGKSYRDVRDE